MSSSLVWASRMGGTGWMEKHPASSTTELGNFGCFLGHVTNNQRAPENQKKFYLKEDEFSAVMCPFL